MGDHNPAVPTLHSPYVEYTHGNTNLIFSVPHDGHIKLPTIPVRRNGSRNSAGVCIFPGRDDCDPEDVCKVVTEADLNSKEIANIAFDKYVENTGKTPHMITSLLHRSMLDPNRPIEEAAQGNDVAIEAYKAFHESIKHAHETLEGKPGLHIDFHGYTDTHKQNSTMIGYLFNTTQLNSREVDVAMSSIQALVRRTRLSVEQLLHGEHSLGSLFESVGYKAVPSPRQPCPGSDKYYRGGWITQVHGSRDGGVIDAVQLEFPTQIRVEATKEERYTFGAKLGENIEKFQSLYYK